MKKIIVIMVMLFALPAASCGRQEQQAVSGNNEEAVNCKEMTAVDLNGTGSAWRSIWVRVQRV